MPGLLSGGAARLRAASSRDTKPRPTVLERLEGSVLETVSIRNAPSLYRDNMTYINIKIRYAREYM